MRSGKRRLITAGAVFFILWFSIRYLLGLLLPFILGAAIALAAEPAVKLCQGRLGLKRSVSAGVGVSATLVLALSLTLLLGALLLRQVQSLAGKLPDVVQAARQGFSLAQSRLTQLADGAPEGLRPLAQKAVAQAFGSDPTALLSGKLPGLLSGMLSRIPGGALGIGTGVLAGFMLSARLPKIRAWLQPRLPRYWTEKALPALKQVRRSLWGWIKAQSKLAFITYGILTLGFLLLGIPYAPLWALPVALVDAVPVLGTGTVLLPWAAIELLLGDSLRAIGLLLTWGASVLTRTALEPRLVGKQLGLDPLVTLICFYFGFRLWGVAGMLLAPLLAATAKSVGQLAVDS